MNAYELRNHFSLKNYNTAISREAFEEHFRKTEERITFTFGGWDGKSYDGETKTARIYRTDIPGYEEVRIIKVGKGLHYIEEDTAIIEKATGIPHKRASWLVDVLRKEA